MEQWTKFLPDYSISNFGRIRNDKNDYIRTPQKRRKNMDYLSVVIASKNYCIHRLVAEHFVPNPEYLPVVRHIDHDPTNNHYSNLQWGTQKDNIHDSLSAGRHTSTTSDASKRERFVANKPASKKRIKASNLPIGVIERTLASGRKRYYTQFACQAIGKISLGAYDTAEEAGAAVEAKRIEVYGKAS